MGCCSSNDSAHSNKYKAKNSSDGPGFSGPGSMGPPRQSYPAAPPGDFSRQGSFGRTHSTGLGECVEWAWRGLVLLEDLPFQSLVSN